MPELPEVETIRRELELKIVGKKIKSIEIEPGFIKKISPIPEKFLQLSIGKTFRVARRRGKLLMFELGKDLFLLVHLKMTGQLIFLSAKGEAIGGGHPIVNQPNLPNKFTRVTIAFVGGARLFYNDVRKFGYLKLVNHEEMLAAGAKYGIEPIDQEYTLDFFEQMLSKRPRMKIKQLLLEQKVLAGLGNIYADETCFRAAVKPWRLVGSLKKMEKEKLWRAARDILREAIKLNGTTFNNYARSDGAKGGFQKKLMVYGRYDQPCKKCSHSIVRVKLGGRSSCFCPHCQK